MSAIELAVRDNGQLSDAGTILGKWKRRMEAARRHRRQFEPTWRECQFFAAGKHWQEFNPTTREWRTLRSERGRTRRTADVLMQNVWTVFGALAADDFRQQFVFEHDDSEGESIADYVNKAQGYGWDYEWRGDERIHELLLYVLVISTSAIRCRYDRSKGPTLAHRVPLQNGQPIRDQAQAHAYLEQQLQAGQEAQFGSIREGQVCWDVLSSWNLLPPPGITSPDKFPWEIIVRPVHLDELKEQYGAAGATVKPESIDSMDVLGEGRQGFEATGGSLEEHALVYTGYDLRAEETFVFTQDVPLDFKPQLPYPATSSRAASSGVVYFGYWPVPGQFWHRSFIQPGVEPQKALNKRKTQADEVIDRSMPWTPIPASTFRKTKPPTGRVMEWVEWPENAPLPQTITGLTAGAVGAISADVQQLKDDVSDALGVKEIALGESPPGANGNYSYLALLKESEATKLGPVTQRFRLALGEVSVLSLEAMKRWWPRGKKLSIVSEEDKLQVLQWDSGKIPDEFVIRPAKGAQLPRSLAAQLALVDDLFNAANLIGLSVQKPAEWFDWYRRSKEAGKVEDPPDAGIEEQQHKAELENLAMLRGADPLPVAPYDNGPAHVAVHGQQLEELSQLLEVSGLAPEDLASAERALQVIEAHLQMHMQADQQNQGPSMALPPAAAPMGAGAPPLAPVG